MIDREENRVSVGIGKSGRSAPTAAPVGGAAGAPAATAASMAVSTSSLSLRPIPPVVVPFCTDSRAASLARWGSANACCTLGRIASQSGVATLCQISRNVPVGIVGGLNNFTITASVTDEDGTFAGLGSKPLTVTNVPPTVSLTGAASVPEGSSYSLTVGGYTDPGQDTPAAVTINWGDGTSTPLTAAQVANLRPGGGSISRRP